MNLAITPDLVHAAGVLALAIIAVEILAIVVILAAYTHETRSRARSARRIETLYSAQCPDDITNLWETDR